VRYVREPVLNYPLLARRAREQGTVVLRITVDANGQLKQAAVHRSSGFERLDQAALRDIHSARFAPQTEDGKPIEWQALTPLAYDL
jgi:protein TonB